MTPQSASPTEEQPRAVAQMIAAVCAALRDAGSPREQAQPPAGALPDPLAIGARLERVRTRLDRIDAQVRELEAELALLKRIAGESVAAAADDERLR